MRPCTSARVWCARGCGAGGGLGGVGAVRSRARVARGLHARRLPGCAQQPDEGAAGAGELGRSGRGGRCVRPPARRSQSAAAASSRRARGILRRRQPHASDRCGRARSGGSGAAASGPVCPNRGGPPRDGEGARRCARGARESRARTLSRLRRRLRQHLHPLARAQHHVYVPQPRPRSDVLCPHPCHGRVRFAPDARAHHRTDDDCSWGGFVAATGWTGHLLPAGARCGHDG
mmetsp:Transcript_27313/g.89429  ORF Transcript_27313/g.89429 Transcript_27313/m.89429 type:complete len:232 (-) Transcript_27313:1457-2152(-)